jgi:DNA polymerase-1
MGACLVFDELSPEERREAWNALRPVFLNGSRKITQNGVFDIKFLWANKVRLANWYSDTILEDHLLDENQRHGLEFIAKRYTDMGGYHDELDAYVEGNPEANPRMCRVQGKEGWMKVRDAERKELIIIEVGSYAKIPRQMLYEYACMDADATLRAHKVMYPLLEKEHLLWVLHNIQMPTQKVLAKVEYSGVMVDIAYNAQLREEYKQKIAEAWNALHAVPEIQAVEEARKNLLRAEWAGKKKNRKSLTQEDFVTKHRDKWEFRLSAQYLSELMLGQFHMPELKWGKPNKKTKVAAASMDKTVLAEYAKTLPVAQQIMDYRNLVYLNGTFVDGLSYFIHEDGKIRSNYPLFRTVTGRPSSFQPNLNNIPRRKAEIKYQFIADQGDWLVEADLSQIEFRIWASYSNDEQMVKDINAGLDIHKITAAMGKGLIIPMGEITYEQFKEWTKDVTKEERNIAKTVVFGMMYGRGAKSIADSLGITLNEARQIVNLFFGRYPTAQKWLAKTTNLAKQTGVVTNLYGRKRRLPILVSADKDILRMKATLDRELGEYNDSQWEDDDAEDVEVVDLTQMKENHEEAVRVIRGIKAKAERQAVNSPIQGGASDTNFLAAVRIDKEIVRRRLKSRMVLTVYDSLIYSVKPNELEEMLELIHTEMLRKTEWINVRLDCEVKVGRVWGKLEEVHFTEDHHPLVADVAILNMSMN